MSKMQSNINYLHLFSIRELEEMVVRLKQEYLRAADRKRHDPLTAQRTWTKYSKVLHVLRLRKRKKKE